MPLELPSEGLFPTKEALVKHCKDHAISQGYVITKNGGGNARQVVLKCDRGGVRTSQSTGLRTSASRRIGRPFLPYGANTKRDDGQWKLVVKNGTHNHEAEEEIAAHPAARRFDENQMEVFKQLHSARANPRHIMSELRQRNPDIPINSRDMYNPIIFLQRTE